jgi:hypothetical protein
MNDACQSRLTLLTHLLENPMDFYDTASLFQAAQQEAVSRQFSAAWNPASSASDLQA